MLRGWCSGHDPAAQWDTVNILTAYSYLCPCPHGACVSAWALQPAAAPALSARTAASGAKRRAIQQRFPQAAAASRARLESWRAFHCGNSSESWQSHDPGPCTAAVAAACSGLSTQQALHTSRIQSCFEQPRHLNVCRITHHRCVQAAAPHSARGCTPHAGAALERWWAPTELPGGEQAEMEGRWGSRAICH